MREQANFQMMLIERFGPFLSWMAGKKGARVRLLRLFFVCSMFSPMLISGCGNVNGGFQGTATLKEANDLFSQGNYQASLDKYEQIAESHATLEDRVLFEMGILYAHPGNEHRNYQKSLECFQKIIKEYPASHYRQNSQAMMFTLNNAPIKDKQIEILQQEVKGKENEIVELRKTIEALRERVFEYAIQKGSVDRIVIEKNARRLMLISKGDVIKTYKIALGGDPVGPKEREGDNKTPEGTYVIDSRNKGSRYHLALHISYPNDKDRKRAHELGVSPGGNIMIHGIKNGFSWVGDAHAEVDWTKGCIAVTDEEIEEIDKVAPNGTIVEIKP
jgi:lipoprotein-anchoring transpeptidase ErfK/SrfK